MRFQSLPASPRVSSFLEATRRRMERWRQKRTPSTRIPEHLWTSAVELARECGLNRTARTLRLNYYSLKKRLEAAGLPGSLTPEARPKFVELIASLPAPFTSLCECTIELEHPKGAKMRIQLKGAEVARDLEALTRTFWSVAS